MGPSIARLLTGTAGELKPGSPPVQLPACQADDRPFAFLIPHLFYTLTPGESKRIRVLARSAE